MELQDSRPGGRTSPAAEAGPGASPVAASPASIRSMAPWRIGGALALAASFVLVGWQVQRVIDDQPWSDALVGAALAAAVVAAGCVLAWTWTATENARRLIGPATNRELPDPRVAVSEWALPFLFVAVGMGVVAYLGAQVDPLVDDSVSSIPLAVAVIALLLAIPLTYRPLHYLAGVVRQVGGHSAHLAQWMWVPVVLAVVGVGSLVAIRLGVADDSVETSTAWGPLWAVAVVAIVPCVIVIALAWRAGVVVEEAITIAASRRRYPGFGPQPLPPPVASKRVDERRHPLPAGDPRSMVQLVPGANVLRVAIVTLLAGLALLSVVGAAVMFMFWLESNDGGLTVLQQDRAWNVLDALHLVSRVVAFGLLVIVSVWTFVVVLNARRASGRRRNPLVAALSWPAAGFGIWLIADRLIVDQSIGRVIAGFTAQAIVLSVPFHLLERSADVIGARRTPLRMTFVFGVVLLVHVQGLGGLSTIEQTSDLAEFGRLAGYLALGALVQLMSTMAVTEACSSMSRAAEHEAEHHNMIAGQRQAGAPVMPPGVAVPR